MKASDWISVKDILPEVNTMVLITTSVEFYQYISTQK